MRQFFPTPPPISEEVSDIKRWVHINFQRLAASMLTAHDFNTIITAPKNVARGMVRDADGTGWDPGSGAGLYWYDGSAWVKLS